MTSENKHIKKSDQCFDDDYQQVKQPFNENQKLKDEIEELKMAFRIEQAKVRSLKKMLKAEYALSDSKTISFNLLLGLDPTADKHLIKKEFKKLLKALHPDRGGDERLFNVFNEHYSKVK